MGDQRFHAPYARIRDADERTRAIASLRDAEVILALGGAAKDGDTYLANVLTTEALNRHRRLVAWFVAVTFGAAFFIVPRVGMQIFLAEARANWSETLRLSTTLALLLVSGIIATIAYARARRAGASSGV